MRFDRNEKGAEGSHPDFVKFAVFSLKKRGDYGKIGIVLEKWEGVFGVKRDFIAFFKWIAIAIVVGLVVGLAGAVFHIAIDEAVNFRLAHGWPLYLLPVGGLLIAFLYRRFGKNDKGTNYVLISIRSTERLPWVTAPLIFISTVISHFVGASCGREGAALQLGGSMATKMGEWMGLDEKDMHTITMCGMSAGFSALFGTPITAAIFSMEVTSIGIMHYSALVPCVLSAIAAQMVTQQFGIAGESFVLWGIPQLTTLSLARIIVLAALCALVSMLFCIIMHKVFYLYKRYTPNPYVKICLGGCLMLAITLLMGTSDYTSGGMEVVERAIGGEAFAGAFLIKILLTAICLGAGFKGGEIVPSFFAGATFGNVASKVLGLSPSFGAGVGMVAVFCGVTNCPISSILLSLELFGAGGLLFFAMACAVSYMLSGYIGLYSEQKIIYSKTRTEFIDTKLSDE